MDSLTHIYFADKLLRITGLDPSASVCSLFPQIDRVPAYFHRMYGHPFFQIPQLARIGEAVYRTGLAPQDEEHTYAASRFIDERERMMRFAKQFQEETESTSTDFSPDEISVLVSYLSHTYQDIFNNPMQAFLPRFAYPSGKWGLWERLGSVDFRLTLYDPNNISDFRREFFSDGIWSTSLPGNELLVAMIRRTAAACAQRVPEKTIVAAVGALGVNEVDESSIKTCEEWLEEHEVLLEALIEKYARKDIVGQEQVVLS